MKHTYKLRQATKTIVNHINEVKKTKDYIYVAFDGMSAAGKSTTAKEVASLVDGCVIRMDDFFLQDHQRTQNRLDEVGGNVDYERFTKEVYLPLQERLPFSYRPYNCMTKAYGHTVSIHKKVVIVEGAYSLRPLWRGLFDITVLFVIGEETQKDRINARNNEILAKRFFDEWIPYEHKYIHKYKLEEVVDILVVSDE